MAIGNILKKLMNGGHSSEQGSRKGMSAEETELLWYKEKDRQEAIKRELAKYRKKDNELMWKGVSLNDEHQIAKAKNVFKGNKNVFKEKKKIFGR